MKLLTRIGLTLTLALMLAAPHAHAGQVQLTKLSLDQLLKTVPAETLADAGVDVTRKTGVLVTLPVKGIQITKGDLWLEYPEVLPKTGDPIFYNLRTGKVGGPAAAGIPKSGPVATAMATALTDCVGTYRGPLKAKVEGSKWGIKIKGETQLDCTLQIEALTLSSRNKLGVRGSFTYSGWAKFYGITKTFDLTTIRLDQAAAKTKISQYYDNYKLEYETKIGDLTLNVSVLLNGTMVAGKGKVSGKISKISIKGDGSILFQKQP